MSQIFQNIEAGDFVKGNRIEVVGTKHFLGKHGVVVDVAFELRPGRVAVQLDNTNGALAIKVALLIHEDPNWTGCSSSDHSEDVSYALETTTRTQPSHDDAHPNWNQTPESRNDASQLIFESSTLGFEKNQPVHHSDKALRIPEHDREDKAEDEEPTSDIATILTPNETSHYSQPQPQNQSETHSIQFEHAQPDANLSTTTATAATAFPVSVDGTCPTCQSNYVQHLILLGIEDKDGAPTTHLGATVTKLLEIGWAATCRPTPDVPEPSSFLCYSCGFGFNVDWTQTTLETIFWHALSGDSNNNYHLDGANDGSGKDENHGNDGDDGNGSTQIEATGACTPHSSHPPNSSYPPHSSNPPHSSYPPHSSQPAHSSHPTHSSYPPHSSQPTHTLDQSSWQHPATSLIDVTYRASAKTMYPENMSAEEYYGRERTQWDLTQQYWFAQSKVSQAEVEERSTALDALLNRIDTKPTTDVHTNTNTNTNPSPNTDTLAVTHGDTNTDPLEYVGVGGGWGETNDRCEPNKYVTNFENYTATANFTNFGGRFATHSHEERWEKKNIPKERDMRLLAHFMDPSQLTSSGTHNEGAPSKLNSKPKKLTKAEIKHFKEKKKKRQRQKELAFLRS